MEGKEAPLTTEEIMESTELRKMIAEEVNAKSNVYQAEAQIESAKWAKYAAIGTFLMAATTVLLAIVTILK